MKTNIKTLAILLSVTLSATSYAKPNWCNYSDYFHPADGAPVGLHISDYSSDDNVIVVQKDATSFYVKDTAACPKTGGYAKIHYGIDADNYCDLTVHDASTMWNPEVVASCKGSVNYTGMNYDGTGSYSYSLVFTG